MSSDMTPETALDTAVTTRQAARINQMPAWYPVAAAVSFAAGMTLIGSSWLSSGGTDRLLGFSGTALILVNLVLWPVLVLRWRRSGVVPRADECATTERRRRSLWMTVASFVICAAVWGATGRVGWATIAAGVLFGAETWYRLTGWRQQ